MNIPRLFKLPEYRRFNYRPMYHDPEKEEREARLRKIKAEAGIPVEGQYVSNIRRGAMKSYLRKNEKKVQRQSNLRLVLIIAVLLFIFYLLLYR